MGVIGVMGKYFLLIPEALNKNHITSYVFINELYVFLVLVHVVNYYFLIGFLFAQKFYLYESIKPQYYPPKNDVSEVIKNKTKKTNGVYRNLEQNIEEKGTKKSKNGYILFC